MIITHEFGHFIMAKINGIYVYDFNLGMGPKIFSFKKGETEYVIRPFPIGGSVRMMGEDENNDDPRSFNQKTVWQRMAVIFAGPFMNFITAIVLFMIVFMMLGTPSDKNVVGEAFAGQAAEAAGIMAGDTIESINGEDISGWTQMITVMNEQAPGQVLNIGIERNGQSMNISVKPYFDEDYGRYMIGIKPTTERTGVITAIWLGLKQSYEFTKLLLVALFQMITGQIAPDVAGPVGVVTIVGQAAAMGIQNLLMLAGFLSINLGVLNLFPFPALDGSRLVFLAIEGVRGKPFNREKEGMVHLIGLAVLMCLMVVITYKDILRLINN